MKDFLFVAHKFWVLYTNCFYSSSLLFCIHQQFWQLKKELFQFGTKVSYFEQLIRKKSSQMWFWFHTSQLYSKKEFSNKWLFQPELSKHLITKWMHWQRWITWRILFWKEVQQRVHIFINPFDGTFLSNKKFSSFNPKPKLLGPDPRKQLNTTEAWYLREHFKCWTC